MGTNVRIYSTDANYGKYGVASWESRLVRGTVTWKYREIKTQNFYNLSCIKDEREGSGIGKWNYMCEGMKREGINTADINDRVLCLEYALSIFAFASLIF